MKISAIALLLNLLQIAVAAAPVEPMTAPAEYLSKLASFTAESPLESNRRTITATLTGYSATEDQTDETPCIAASGYDICENPTGTNIVAANFLPLGTKIQIPKLGNEIYVVEDRMHERFNDRIDILFPESAGGRAAAKVFGKQTATVIVFES